MQKGLIPISIDALEKAIQINNVSVEENLSAFNWGRLAAEDIKYVLKKCNLITTKYDNNERLEVLVNNRYNDLIKYHNKTYAMKFKNIINA